MAKRKAKKGNNLILYIYLPIIAVIGFILYFFANSSFNIQKSTRKSGPVNQHTPSQLKWYDSFKGISNNKSKKKQQEEKPKNFINFK